MSQLSHHQKPDNGIGWLLTACFVIAVVIGFAIVSHREPETTLATATQTDQGPKATVPEASRDTPAPSRTAGMELRGRLARRREYDLWLIRNVSSVMTSALSSESRQGKLLAYCMVAVHDAEQSLDSPAATEYELQSDGKVLVTSSGKLPEQRFRDGRRAQLELETGGGPMAQDCAGSLFWFGTWHNQPMPSDEKLAGIVANAKADLEEIDQTLDPRLVQALPKPD